MASTISAGTTSGTALNMAADTTGNLAFTTQAGANTITVPNATGTMMVSPQSLTIPNTTGTVMVSGNMPAFSAYRSGTQAYTSNTYTKIQLNIESFDTANAYDNTTNYRFTPQVAGYYLCTGQIQTSAGTYVETDIYKNGSSNGYSQISGAWGIPTTQLIYLNGSTDYIELYGFITVSGNIVSGTSTYLQAFLVRTA